jgi:putative membrane protein
VTEDWQRLSPRMLLVHPVHEVLRQIPALIGLILVGSATGNPMWAVAALALTVAFGAARWFTTAYRIGDREVQLRSGVLQRTVVSLPRNRIRSVSTDARLLHRLLGLAVLNVSTGQTAKGDSAFALDAVPADQVPGLRAVLLAGSLGAVDGSDTPSTGVLLAQWNPSWLRYSPLSFTGLATIAAAAGLLYQAGAAALVRDSALAKSGLDAAERFGVAATVAVVAVGVVVVSVLLSVAQSLLTYGNLWLRRDADVLHLQHGLLRVRERTYDMRRLRGGSLREPLLVRLFGGARLDAVMTGVGGGGEASLLLPPCPARTARAVLSGLIGRPDAVSGPLRGHGPVATRRRWTRAMSGPVLLAVALAGASVVADIPGWAWPVVAALAVCCALLAADRAAALGHRAGDGWLVACAGSLQRRRDCIAEAGIIGWTVRQTYLQRRAGVATLVAATAAGVKAYRVLDVPAEQAWSIAAAATPWVADCEWAHR